jgi:hypothetical protein
MVSEDCVLLTARSGLPNVNVSGKPYHSPYDPVREAQKFCAALKIEQADVIFLFGWGLGYCGNTLLTRLKSNARVIVFEPNSELFELSRAQTLNRPAFQDRRFQFVVGERIGRFFDDWGLQGCQDTDQLLWIEWPAAVALDGEMLSSLKSSFRTRLRDKAANLLTHFQKGATYFENALANFKYQGSGDTASLFGRFKNIPLVIVSAGPSLDLNIEELRGMADRCFVLAVDTSLRPLLAAGVTPHAVMVADPSALNARHVVGAVPETVYMIAEQAVQPVALESARRRFLFGLGLFPGPLFAKFGFGKGTLEVWGSVATAALDLACRIGANPVIFAGQDFGFSWGREYARHTIFHNNPFSPELGGPMKEPDIWGNPVHTTENLIAYRDFFVRKIRQRPDIRFINATEGGILRDAVEILSLKEALATHCNTPIDVMRMLDENHRLQQLSPAALKHFLKVLKSRSRDCTCLGDFLELTAKQELLKNEPAARDDKIRWGIEKTELALSEL